MKKQTEINFPKKSKELNEELTTVVDETIATDFIAPKNFTIVDLWNIQRNSKTAISSRKLAKFFWR